MDKVNGKLTVYFEEPFWIGVFERIEDGKLSVEKVTFGAEPKDYEVQEYIQKHYASLKFSPAVDAVVKDIKRNPKIICGFSDITSLTNMITEKTGLITFSGTNFKTVATDETDYSLKEALKRFVDGSLELGLQGEEYRTIKQGVEEGQLIGGNLNLTSGMVAGKYSIDFTGKILFLEELGFETEPAMASNFLYYMKQNGVFDKVKGIWLGNYTHESGIKLEDILLDTIGDEFKCPIIKSENFGHIDKKTVIPIGTIARIDTNKDVKIELLENCLSGD